MIRLRLVAAFVAVALVASPASAAAQGSAEVEQVLAALAQVVNDRAKRVAAATVARELRRGLCGKDVTVHGRKKDGIQDASVSLTLTFGGDDACRKRAGPCNADDVFVDTCRLAGETAADLTNPHFLKTMTEEAVATLVRVAAMRVAAEKYEKLGYRAFATYVYRVLELLAAKPKNVGMFAAATFDLADALGTGLENEVLKSLGEDPTARALLAELRTHLPGTCQVTDGPECANLQPANVGLWYPDLPTDTPAPVELCQEWFDAATQRRVAFDALFKDANAAYSAARDRSCTVLGGAEAKAKARVLGCERAQLLVNLTDLLTKAACIDYSPDPRRDLRELFLVLTEAKRNAESLKGHALDDAKLQAFVSAFQQTSLERLPREALANGVRVLATFLRAYGSDPQATKAWLDAVARDVRKVPSQGGDPLRNLYKSSAFDRNDASFPKSPDVAMLRDAIADVVVLPGLYAQQKGDLATFLRVRTALVAGFQDLSPLAFDDANFSGTAYFLAGYLERVSALSEAIGASGDGAAEVLHVMSAVVRSASKGDWIGVGGELVERLDDEPGAVRPLAFVKVLLAMYQADSVDEAKKVFEASLEDETSRQQRWNARFSMDIAALVGGRVGAWQQSAQVGSGDPSAIYGLYGPFGLQLAWKQPIHLGALVYPIDLGTYLTGRTDENDAPKWSDALRLGASVYARPSDRFPLVFGIGADYQPGLERPANVRAQAFVALELPLMVMY